MANSSFFGTSGTTASVTNTIQTSVDAAEAAQAAAEAAQTAAETAETNSETAQAASEAARNSAQGFRDTAETHKNDAETAKTAAETAQAASENARDAASTSATNSATSESNAATSATNAANSATSAASSSTSAAASLASFQGQYSTGTTDPTTNLDAGDLFFNTTDDEFKVYSGTAWQLTVPSSANQTNINTVAGIQSDVTAVAGKATEVGRLGTTDAIADMNLLGTSTNVSNMSTLATNNSNITTVANNISGVNSFAERYRSGASDPSSNNDEGDLFYNTTSNALKVYTGSAWEQGVTAGSGFLPLSGGQLTGNLTFSGSQTVDGRDVSADGTKLDGIEANATADQTAPEIKTAYESNSNTNAFTDALQTKLNGIEANATADQSDAEIKTAYENNSDTNAFTDALLSKLNGIEASATADQSASEIKTAYESNSDTNALTDALLSKLNGIEASADVTDTTNVVAALTAGTDISIAANGTIAYTGSSEVVGDTTPQLGGNLDTNGNAILFGSSKWSIELDTGDNDLLFKYNGTTVFKLASSGAVVSANNVTAYGTP